MFRPISASGLTSLLEKKMQQYCRNSVIILDFACKLVLPEFWQYCWNFGNIFLILAILQLFWHYCQKQRILVHLFIYTYALMESFLSLKYIYSNKKDTSDFHGTVSFDPIKISQQKLYQNVYLTSNTQKLVII